MEDLIIYGAGGFGREVALMVDQINQKSARWRILGFIDDGLKSGTSVDGLPVLGGKDILNSWQAPVSVAIAVADPATRAKVHSLIRNSNVSYPILIHPSAQTGHHQNELGEGSIITAGAILTLNVNLGSFSIVNLSVTIGHDVSIGDYCTLMPACSISGGVKLGSKVMIGTGARLLQNISIGELSKVGAGAVVTKSFVGSTKLLGVPARIA